MVKNIALENNFKERGMIFARALSEIKNTLKDKDLTLTEDTNYDELYNYTMNQMKETDLFQKLNPSGGIFNSYHGIRGEDFTYSFWLYMTSVIRAQNPSDVQVWIKFGSALNSYIYDVSSFVRHMVSDSVMRNKFPVAKLINDCGVFNRKEIQTILLHLMESDTFLEAIMRPHGSESFYRVVQRFNNILTLPFKSWVQLGHIFRKVDIINESLGRKEEYDIQQLRQSLLFGADIDETFKYIDRYVHGMISEVQQADEDFESSGNISGTVISEFIITMEPRVKEIFDSNFKVSTISMPLDELQLKLLLLTQETLNDNKYGYYDYGSFYNAHTIYIGKPDPDAAEAYSFRKELHKELYLSAVGGYTEALENYNLKLPV